MYVNLQGVEQEIVEKTALEENIDIDKAVKHLLYLGRGVYNDKHSDPQVKTEAIEAIKDRLESIAEKMDKVYIELRETAKDAKELF